MTLVLGLYEVAAYAIPGAAWLALLTFTLDRLGWLPEHLQIATQPALEFVALTALAFALGHLTYNPARWLDQVWRRSVPRPLGRRGEPSREAESRRQFQLGCPNSAGRPFLTAHMHVLLAAAELRAKDVMVEVERLNSGAIMSRNLVPPLWLGSLVLLVDEFSYGQPLAAVTMCAGLLAMGWIAWVHCEERFIWGQKKILEVAYWHPEIDVALASAKQP